jgi:3-isopropylmalate/(R)-2-methylmalate dehydratase small subunit
MSDEASDVDPRQHIVGTAITLFGDDIDTDQIIPARFLKGVSFAGLGDQVFADARQALLDRGETHPFDDRKLRGARILLVGQNFGCGSSRERAPQALHRWGIAAIVGESFGEIFASNCVAIGVPCLRMSPAALAHVRDAAAVDSSRLFAIDIEQKTISSGNLVERIELSEGARAQLLDGTWDATATLLAAGEAIERTGSRLPYLNRWT